MPPFARRLLTGNWQKVIYYDSAFIAPKVRRKLTPYSTVTGREACGSLPQETNPNPKHINDSPFLMRQSLPPRPVLRSSRRWGPRWLCVPLHPRH